MAAKKASTGKRNTGSAVAQELDQLKKQVKEQTLRLEREVKARKLDVRLAAKAKKARAQLSKEIGPFANRDGSSRPGSSPRWLNHPRPRHRWSRVRKTTSQYNLGALLVDRDH